VPGSLSVIAIVIWSLFRCPIEWWVFAAIVILGGVSLWWSYEGSRTKPEQLSLPASSQEQMPEGKTKKKEHPENQDQD
jgi:hypothetical protein